MILSEFMRMHRHDDPKSIDSFIELFTKSQANVSEVFGSYLFRRYRMKDGTASFETSISKAVFELQMVSLSFLDHATVASHANSMRDSFKEISLNNKDFADALSRATDHRSRFYQRLRIWDAELAKLGLKSELTGILAAVKD
jgi:hypothetical protein